MIGSLIGFVEELRAVGIPVSMVEALDAAAAIEHVDLADRAGFQEALAATLVKNSRHRLAFDIAFDVFFGLKGPQVSDDGLADPGDGPVGTGQAGRPGGGAPLDDAGDLVERLFAALGSGDRDALIRAVRAAVSRLGGMEPGRPVGGRYYLYRVMRRLDVDELRRRLAGEEGDGLRARLGREEADARIDELVTELRREITRRLVADRGTEAVAKTLRRPLVEDLDLTHATREELDQIEQVIQPLSRKLASRLARRRKGRDGRLDVRSTIRRSLAHGGVLLDPRFKPPRRSKPELVVICDVSGSMATFARFTMQLVYAIAHQFSKVRSFAFVDALDEVTDFFAPGVEFHDALLRMGREAHLVWQDGHSDYGHSLQNFHDRYRREVTSRSTVIVTGDARNNYRSSSVELFAEVADTARRVYWLNPESRRYWDTGDSIMSTYAPWCDGVFEVRTLRQLEHFVEEVAAAPAGRPSNVSLK